jgi:hypothetical protein
MLLTLLNNNLQQAQTQEPPRFQSTAAQPQIAAVALAVIAGSGFYQAALQNPQGNTASIEYTFGVHAATLYNAEAEKSDYWTPLSAGARPTCGAYVVTAPLQTDSWPQQPAITRAIAPQPPGTAASYISAAPPNTDALLLQPALRASQVAGATPTTGAYAYARPADPPPLPSYAWPAPNAGPGILGAYTSAPPVQEALKQAPPPSLRTPLTAGPGFLGAFVAGAPQEQPKQAPPVWLDQPLVAGPGKLGAFTWAVGQDPTQSRAWQLAPIVAGPGFLGHFAWATGQDPTQPPARVQAAAPTPPVLTTGFLGSYATVAAQDQRQPSPAVRAALVAGATPTLGAFARTLEQPQDRPTGQRWPSALSPAALGSFTFTLAQVPELRGAWVWSPTTGPAQLGVYAHTLEQPQERPAVQRWPSVASPIGSLGAFVATAGQDQRQTAAQTWAPTGQLLTGRLGRFAYVAEQGQIQDRPTAGIWVSVAAPAPLVFGPPFRIRAWAVDQWGGTEGARTAFREGGAGFVVARYYAEDGELFVPEAVAYRIDDVHSGQNLVPWTSLAPAMQNLVTITAAQNAMVSLTRQHEAHQVLFRVTETSGVVDYARVIFNVVRTVGSV